MKASHARMQLPTNFGPAEKIDGNRRERLVAWLGAGLRRDEPGQLEREYPLSMGETRGHRGIFEGDRPVAHAMLHPAQAVARDRCLGIGMIGNVYTEPARRGLGLASACIGACVEDARQLGLPLAILWSDAWDFYRRLGFLPAGRETQLTLDGPVLVRAWTSQTSISVGPPHPGDWSRLEELYARKPQHARRRPGDLERLAAAPATRLRVARIAGQIVGYAAAGRGDDFQGVVHEWAGEDDAVIACLHYLHGEAGVGTILCGPEEEPLTARLREAGAAAHTGCFGLIRLLDAGTLWSVIAPKDTDLVFSQEGERVVIELGSARSMVAPEAALDLLLGRGTEGPTGHTLPVRIQRRLAPILPWPLYLWGFDSI